MGLHTIRAWSSCIALACGAHRGVWQRLALDRRTSPLWLLFLEQRHFFAPDRRLQYSPLDLEFRQLDDDRHVLLLLIRQRLSYLSSLQHHLAHRS